MIFYFFNVKEKEMKVEILSCIFLLCGTVPCLCTDITLNFLLTPITFSNIHYILKISNLQI